MKTLRVLVWAVAALVVGVSMVAPAVAANDDVLIVYDASGSMWGQIDGVNKIVIARDVVSDLIRDWPTDTNIGLVAYGHRRAGDCRDIETLIKPGPINRKQFIETIRSLDPKGKTPISASLKQAAEVLSYRDTNATIILISDGMESCHGDPCAVAKSLEAKGINFTAHVVGFDLSEEGNKSLACIADNTGGIFVPASNAQELAAALQKVQAVVEKKQAPPEITLTAPEQVKAGEAFEVSWSAVANAKDQVMLVPVEAEANSSDSALQVGDNRSGELIAPAQTGSYAVRYVSADSGQALASAPVQVISKVEISAPKQVTAGAVFEVTWTKSLNPKDFYTIVAAGAEDGAYGEYHRVEDSHEGKLTAPSKPGMYEVRYLLGKGNVTLASAPVEVTEAKTSISAPKQVTAGTVFEVSWTTSVSPKDFFTIVPAGAEDGAYGEYHRVEDRHEGKLTAPSKPGMYEVRYLLDKDNVTLASTPVEVVEAEVGISAPKQVTAGTVFEVTWTESVNPRDFYTIVPAGAEDGAYGEYHRVEDRHEGKLTAPSKPGMYEVRYLLDKDNVTLASTPVEVVEAEVGISAPKQVTAGMVFEVTWTESVNPRDFYTIVPAGAEDGAYGEYHRVEGRNEGKLTAPSKPGMYEVRYLLDKDNVTLASAPVEVVGAEVGISAPEKVRAGTVFAVTWSSNVNSRDFYTIVPAGAAEGEYGEYHRVGDTQTGKLTAPDKTGFYEVRYVLDKDNVTLASTTVEVVPADAALSSGASLQAPAEAAPGDTITVTWTGGADSEDQRVSLAKADAADFTWIEVHAANADKSLQFTIPDEPGRYEIRYLDISNMKVLGRAIVQVK